MTAEAFLAASIYVFAEAQENRYFQLTSLPQQLRYVIAITLLAESTTGKHCRLLTLLKSQFQPIPTAKQAVFARLATSGSEPPIISDALRSQTGGLRQAQSDNHTAHFAHPSN
jgi:hypothetical protein